MNDYHRLNLAFEFYDNNKLFKSIINNTFNEGNTMLKNILYKNNLYIPLYQDVTKLRIKILLTIYNSRGVGNINVSTSNKNSDNFRYIKCLEKTINYIIHKKLKSYYYIMYKLDHNEKIFRKIF